MRRALVLISLAAVAVLAQRGFQGYGQRVPERGHDPFEEVAEPRDGEFHFIRMEYTDLPQHHRGFGYDRGLIEARIARLLFGGPY